MGWGHERLSVPHTSRSFCFWWFVFDVSSPLRIVWVGEVDVHLTQKQKRKYSLSGADVEDVPRGGKGWN